MDSEKYVCCDCIGDNYLKREIANGGDVQKCYYCDSDKAAILFDELADRVDAVFREFYTQGGEYVDFEYDSDKPSYFQNGDEPSLLINQMLWVDNTDISDDILAKLYSDESYAVNHDCSEVKWHS